MQLWFSIYSFMKKWKHEGFMRIFFCVSNSCITVHPTFHYLSLLWIYLFETICQKILKVPTMQQTLSWVAFITTMNFWDLMPDKFLNLKIRKVMPRPFIGPKKLDLIKTFWIWFRNQTLVLLEIQNYSLRIFRYLELPMFNISFLFF